MFIRLLVVVLGPVAAWVNAIPWQTARGLFNIGGNYNISTRIDIIEGAFECQWAR
jgi:hypothetical protein